MESSAYLGVKPIFTFAFLCLGVGLAISAPQPPGKATGKSPTTAKAETKAPKTSTAGLCPAFGWSEGLAAFLLPDAKVPTQEPMTDCDFHEWSWETFVWAVALDSNQAPRFLSLPTIDDLIQAQTAKVKGKATRVLRLASRSKKPHGLKESLEVAGAIVEADGNMLVAPNGYPVYASVHMDSSYFAVAKNNLIYNGGYQKNAGSDAYFPVGAAVFKATWLRVDSNSQIPAGAYTVQAEVPVLTIEPNTKIVVTSGKFVTATVALVGLHVVGITVGHPEFLWATFEHNRNTPRTADNTFSPDSSSPQNFTFYKANTKYALANQPNTPPNPATSQTPVLSFNEKTQRFSPYVPAVLENKTGGETNSPQGPQNIANLNASGQGFLRGLSGKQSLFANYDLIGTVWMKPNTYVTSNPQWDSLDQVNGVGSVNLANSTAETFEQVATDTVQANVQNCFLCHNAQSYPGLKPRRIAISHVLSVSDTTYAVPNQLPLCWDVQAGPIWNREDAKAKCQKACGSTSTWNGQWKTVVQGQASVCGCCNP